MGQRCFSLMVLFALLFATGKCVKNLQGLPDEVMFKDGDLNLGAIIHFRAYSIDPVCADYTSHAVLHQLFYFMIHKIDKINRDPTILPNVTLGYVILDDCTRVIPSVPRALQLMPVLESTRNQDNALTYGKQYDVVGIIGPYNSEPNMVVASMAGFFEVPQISPYASSDALSDKTRFPYFFRTISPDRKMIQATVQFAKQVGWEYISVIYTADEFGFNTDKYARKYALEEGICIEESYPIDTNYQTVDFNELLEKITAPEKKARVFIVNLINSHSFYLLKTIGVSTKPRDYIMIFSQCLDMHVFIPMIEKLDGFIHLGYGTSDINDFMSYYKYQVNPWNSTGDPWISALWEQYFGCKINPSNGETPCDAYSNLFDFRPAPGQNINRPALNGLGMADSVELFAVALDGLIKAECAHAVGNQTLLRKCINGNNLRHHLSKSEITSTDVYGKSISFDENFDGVRDYFFTQVQAKSKRSPFVKIGIYHPQSGGEQIEVFFDKLSWPPYLTLDKRGILESVCSHPCSAGEIYIQGDVNCCWTCHRCRDNEIVSLNASVCRQCPLLTWPDENTFDECVAIPPSYITWSHIYGIGMMILACLGLVGSFLVIVVMIKYDNNPVIRGSSKELMAIIMAGAVLAYLTIPTFIMKPTSISCIMSRIGFSASCSLIFAPLLIKSIRIFRIFRYSERFEQTMCLVSTVSQLFLVALCILVQVGLIVVTGFIWSPYAELRMPIDTEKYVELQCDLNIYGLLIPLSYNIFLTLLCAICGFVTRKLPDNFNESWYIFVSVCTTLFIWIAFLPTYFAAFYAFHKAILLALALFLNSTITIICLFCPKIYAVLCKEDPEMKITKFKGGSSGRATSMRSTTSCHSSEFTKESIKESE